MAKHNRIAKLCLAAAVALFLVMYNIDKDGDVGKATADLIAGLSDEIVRREGTMPLSEDEAIAMRREGIDVILIDGNAYIGYLSVPSQSLELPILAECSDANLKIAPCCYSGSCYESGFVLAGHNYRSHFGRLNNLRRAIRSALPIRSAL